MLLVGGLFLIPLDIWYSSMRSIMVAADPITYSGPYLAFTDAWIHWLPFIIIFAGLVGIWVETRLRPGEVMPL